MEINRDRLLQAMLQHDLSARALAEKCGLSNGSVSRYLNGKQLPKIEQVQSMANVLGVSLEWLAGQDDKQSMDDDMTVQIVEAMKGLDRKQMVLLLAFIKSMRGTDES